MMDWYPWYFTLYEADTQHLSCLEDGAYRRLIDHYMKTRMPLPDNDRALANIVRLPLAEWMAIAATIREFFTAKGGKLQHRRCNIELEQQDAKSTRRSAIATKAAAGRWPSPKDAAERGRKARSQRLAEARKKGSHTAAQWEALVTVCGGECLRCGATDNIVKDHIVPIYQGGSDGIENLQPLCVSCNSSKGRESKDLRPDNWNELLHNACERRAEALPDASEMPARCLPLPATGQGQDKTETGQRKDRGASKPKRPLEIDDEIRAFAAQHSPRVANLHGELDRYRDWKRSSGTVHRDERAGFRNWLRKAEQFAVERGIPLPAAANPKNGDAAIDRLTDEYSDPRERTDETLVIGFKTGRMEWAEDIRGPAPGKPGCRVAEYILRHHGYLPPPPPAEGKGSSADGAPR